MFDADTVALGRKMDVFFVGGGINDFLLDEFDVGFSQVESGFGDLWKLDLGVMMRKRFSIDINETWWTEGFFCHNYEEKFDTYRGVEHVPVYWRFEYIQ